MSLICRRTPQKGAARLALLALAALIFVVPLHDAGASHGALTLDVEYETASGVSSSANNVEVKLVGGVAAADVVIDAEITGPNDPDSGDTPASPDTTCTITTGNNSCALPFAPSVPSFNGSSVVDTFRVWIDHDNDNTTVEADPTEGAVEERQPGGTAEPDTTDVVVRVTNAQFGSPVKSLDCKNSSTQAFPSTEESLKPNTGPGSKETYTCTVRVGNNAPVLNALVDVENLFGPNDLAEAEPGNRDYTCGPTDVNGTCSVTIPTEELTNGEQGTALLCFWIDENNDDVFDTTDPANGGACPERWDTAESGSGPDVSQVDVARITWEAPTPTTLNITTEDLTRNLEDEQEVGFAVHLKDQFGHNLEGGDVGFRVLAGPNRLGSTREFGCTTISDGTCTGTLVSAAPNYNGTDQVCAWLDSDHDDAYVPGGDAADGGDCADEEPAPGSDDGGLTDRGQVVWSNGTPFPTRLEMTPETSSANAGTSVAFTVTVTDEQNQPIDAANVDVEITGAGDPDAGDSPDSPDKTCNIVESGNGACIVNVSSAIVGDATIRAWVDIDDDNEATIDEEVDRDEGADAGDLPDEPAGTPDTPGSVEEPDATDVVTVRWVATPTQVTIGYSSSVIEYAQPVTLSGVLTAGGQPLADKTVVVERRLMGASGFATLATTMTDANGAWSFTGKPGSTAEYRASFVAEPPGLLGSRSPVTKIAVRVIIPTTATPTNASLGTAVAFEGKVLPIHSGKRVYLQVAGPNNSWRSVATTLCNGAGAFRMTYRRNSPGTLNFRILYASGQDLDHGGNYSAKFSIRWA